MIKPRTNHILIPAKRDGETTTESGIILTKNPENEKEVVAGVVSAIGPEVLDILEGDTVLYRRYGGDKVSYEGEDYVVVTEDDVVAKFDQDIVDK